MRVSAKIGLTIVVFIIATFLMGVLNATKGTDSPELLDLLIGVGLIVSIVFIWKSKPKNKIEKEFEGESVGVPIDTISFSEQKKTLFELKKANLLTESEYEKKITAIESRENEILMKEEEEDLLQDQQQHSALWIKKLEYLLKSGILTQKEYEEKKDQVYAESRIQLEKIPCKRIKFSQLSNWHKRAFRKYLKLSKYGDIILINLRRNSIFLLTKEEFNELKKKQEIEDYYYVSLNDPNLI